MKKALLFLVAISMLFVQACKKENDSLNEEELVKNKLIIGEWTLQSYSFKVYDATTGQPKSTQDYDISKIKTITFRSDGKYYTNIGSSGEFGIDQAGTVIILKSAAGVENVVNITTIDQNKLNLSTTEVSENTQIVLMQYFTR